MSFAVSDATVIRGQGLNFSGTLWSLAAGVNKVHGLWKIYIKGTTYLNPDNFFGLSVGMIYQTVIGDRFLLKLPTVPFFVMSRFLNLFEQEDEWNKSWSCWKETFQGIQPIHTRLTVEYANNRITWFHYSLECLWIRVQRIAYCTLLLAVETFKLIMRIMDIVELITLDPAKLNEFVDQSVRECGLHIPRCLNTLVKNKQMFISRLESKEEGINDALKWLGSEKIKGIDVIKSAKSMFDHCEKGLELYQQAGDFVGDAIKNLGRKFIYEWSPEGVQQMLKEHNLAPDSDLQSVFQKKYLEQYIRPRPTVLRYGLPKFARQIKFSTACKSDPLGSPKTVFTPPISPKHYTTSPKRIVKVVGVNFSQ